MERENNALLFIQMINVLYARRLNPMQLVRLGASVVRCVQAAQRHGHVVIVTDSDKHWVRGTAELLLPSPAVGCLKNIEVVSSKERFARLFPDQKACWQIAAFSYVTNRHLLGVGAEGEVREPASCGGHLGATEEGTSGRMLERKASWRGGHGIDTNGSAGTAVSADSKSGEQERDLGVLVAVTTASRAGEDKSAMRTLRDHHPRIVAKTVSLIKAPTPQELRKQLDLLSENFAWMFGYPRHTPSSVSTPECMPSKSTRASLRKIGRVDTGDDDARTNTTEGYTSLADSEEEHALTEGGRRIEGSTEQMNDIDDVPVLNLPSSVAVLAGE